MQIQMKKISDLHEFANNPRRNDDAVDAVAKSIETFGFKVPLVIDKDNMIVCGHTRYKAAVKLELQAVPCIVADDLTPEQVKAFRLADNKTNELAQWDVASLAVELEELATAGVDNMADYGFDVSENWWRQAAWKKVESFCNLKKRVRQNSHGDFFSTTFFESNKKGDGENIKALKENPNNVQMFADCLVDYVLKTLGSNLAAGGWCMMTTPRRRHKNFHFSTMLCATAAKALSMTFYEDAVTAKNRNRIEPEFELAIDPPERNVLLVDDIISTGETIRTTRRLLLDAGHTVLAIAAIRNT